MRRDPQNARRFNDRITLTRSVATVDSMSHASIGDPVAVLEVYAQVRQMSATKTMLTFQQADVVGVDIEFRKPEVDFDGITATSASAAGIRWTTRSRRRLHPSPSPRL